MTKELKILKDKYNMYCMLTNDLLRHTCFFYHTGTQSDINDLIEFFNTEDFKNRFSNAAHDFYLMIENIENSKEKGN
jgi:ABC-type enterochelin transport system ATPase subunit